MSKLYDGLTALGFELDKDFTLVDHGDGRGVLIVWHSEATQPSLREIETAAENKEPELPRRDFASELDSLKSRVAVIEGKR